MICPYCNSDIKLEKSTIIYNYDYGFIWICSQYPKCDAYVGCHPGTTKPLGIPANNILRKWRNLAHSSFDVLWRRKQKKLLKETNQYKIKKNTKYIARSSGYKWLSSSLDIQFDKCHIGMFDIDQCKKVIELCLPYLHVEHKNNIYTGIKKISDVKII